MLCPLLFVTPSGGHAQALDHAVLAGELTCTVEGRLEVVVSANRDLTCAYIRAADGRTELYTGYTGVVGAGLGFSASYEVTFQVFAPLPRDQAILEGDFQSRLAELSGPRGLVGGQSGEVHLRPIRDSATPIHSLDAAPVLAPLNAVAGFGYLHLIYAGVVPSLGAHRGRR